jgi:hypothetical protein
MEKSIVRLAVMALTCTTAVGLSAACSSSSASSGAPNGTSNEEPDAASGISQEGDASVADVTAPDAADGSTGSSSTSVEASTSVAPGTGVQVGVTTSSPSAALPGLAGLTNVVAQQREDSVGIDFDPVDNAVDYRVYVLPNDSDVTTNADKSVTIKNAVYRCAGVRQTLDLPNNTGNDLTHPDAGQTYAYNQYSWQATVPANPTLGYVYVTPASDRQPVYAIGVHPATNENGWRETRPKIYTTSSATRQTLLSKGGRDDGIVFYVPATSSSSTTTVYHSENNFNSTYAEYYFTSADMAAHASDNVTPPTAAFPILTAAADGTKPLMAVLYQPSQFHTELAVGKERFKRAASQGPGPLWHLEWSGVTKPTTLVVEALASGCPFQGFLSPQALSAPPHQTLYTLQQLQQASRSGEVFINGQYTLPGGTTSNGTPFLTTTTSSPVVMARSFVQVSPQPHDATAWDYYQGFSGDGALGAETPSTDQASCSCSSRGTPCDNGSGFCGYWTSPILNFGFYEADDPNHVPVFTHGQTLGQLWHVFDDWGQDVTGTVRFTAPTRPAIPSDSSKYLHVTWSVNAVSTDRRYPQLIVSDQPGSAQTAFANPNGNTVLLQTIVGPSVRFEAQAFHGLVNGAPWAVNNQSTHHGLIDADGWSGSSGTGTMQPSEPVFEHIGVDRMTKFDAYFSSGRVFTFVDGTPAGCVQYPTGVNFAMGGNVSLTFGDVLYHEGAPDELVCSNERTYAFLHSHECTESKRHWDDLGFKSGVDAPTWDFTNFPCLPF